MHQNAFTLIGAMATDVTQTTTRDGVALARFRICVPSPRGRDGDGQPSFMAVTCWRRLAENVASSLRRGDPVIVTGRLRSRTVKRNERLVTSVEIEAVSVGPDLSRVRASPAAAVA
jgi:single-strand DNA-binding protein